MGKPGTTRRLTAFWSRATLSCLSRSCPSVADRQAAGAQRPYEDEVALLLVHGILHLLGHDHAEPDETAAMQQRERELLGLLHVR